MARSGSLKFPINKGFGVIHFRHQTKRKRKGVRERKRCQKKAKNLLKNEKEKGLVGKVRVTIVKHDK